MKVVFICPFPIERLTGTPIRAKIVIQSVETFSTVETISTSNRFLKFVSESMGKLQHLKPDVIHGFTTMSIVPMMLYKIAHPHTKIVFEMHGWSWFETKGQLGILKRIVFLFLDIFGYLFANSVIVMSCTQKDFLRRWFGGRKNVNVVWGPADFPISFEKPEERDGLLVGYQGNSSWWQGLHILIETARILEKNPKIHFQLAGFDSSDKSKFPDRPNIKYLGRFERKDVTKLIKNCDVMVSPRLDGDVSDLQYPQKLSEYLAGGRPVIAFDTSDQRLIVEKANAGFIVGNESAKELAEAIEKFSQLPAESRSKLGENAGKFAEENFSPSVFVRKYEQAYKELG